jgi:hypothetical protein
LQSRKRVSTERNGAGRAIACFSPALRSPFQADCSRKSELYSVSQSKRSAHNGDSTPPLSRCLRFKADIFALNFWGGEVPGEANVFYQVRSTMLTVFAFVGSEGASPVTEGFIGGAIL